MLTTYGEETREWDPERVHVSDLTSCLRRPVLSREFFPQWQMGTLLMFTLGRAFEHYVFKELLPDTTQEMEVEEDGIQGHIDFASEPYDYECKLTWKREGEVEDLFERSQYWVDQAGAYAVMRRRRACRFAVLHVGGYPPPSLRIYKVEWTAEEQGELWKLLLKRKDYVRGKVEEGELPMKTLDTNLCKTCQVKEVCDAYGN